MKNICYTLLIITTLTISSCGTVDKSNVFRPDNVRLNIAMSDLAYMGEVEVSISYRTYLGFIRVIDQVNGESYNSFDVKKANFGKDAGCLLYGPIKKATYKAIQEYPEATYFQPVYKTIHKNRLFLGSEVTTTAIIRAYKFK